MPHRQLLLLAALASALSLRPAAGADDEEKILREAEKIERSVVHLVDKLQDCTVSVIRYVEQDVNGEKIEAPGGVGSGVIVSRDGKIFTNVHVIAGASRVEVVFRDGTTKEAEVWSEVPKYDFALLLVKGTGYAAADWANSNAVEPGHWTIAAGNPRGLAMRGSPVVTLGIVSGTGRIADGRYSYGNAIQTDAEINPGNSGGPLFDLSGRVLGINGKIATVNGGQTNVGVGYTIPSRQVKNFLPSMYAGGEVAPGHHGLRMADKTHESGGVLVKGVEGGSPAAKAGVKSGDIVTGMNNNTIDSYTTWMNEVSMLPNGYKMTLRVVRNGRVEVKKFTLRER